MRHKVFVVRCADYEQAAERLGELVDCMGGMGRFAGPGETVALKANLLRKATPEEAVSTHPAIVSAVAVQAVRAGADPVIVDSPGGGFKYTEKVLEGIYRASGMQQAAEASGARLNFDTTHETVSHAEGHLIKRFEVITPVVTADRVFNLCKLKTHSFTSMTGAVKNNFGVIPGLAKPGYHAKLRDKQRFAGMLLDLADWVAPQLSIMDAVVAMEGDGPGTGDPRPLGLILAAESPLAVDVVAGEIIGLPRENHPVLVEAEKRGREPNCMDHIELIGADIPELRIRDFKFPPTLCEGTGFGSHLNWWQRMVEPLFKNGLTLKPRVIMAKCVACGACVKGCPVEAVVLEKGGKTPCARIDDDRCIRCYCCHEMCAEEAIALRRSMLYRLMNR